jgi:cell division protein FtsW
MRLKMDWPLFLTVLFLVSLGLVFVFSASSVAAQARYGGSAHSFFLRQVGAAILAFCALMAFSQWDYRRLMSERWAFVCLGVVMGLLIVVYFADREYHRWLRIGPLGLQPSEFAKPALIVFLAWYVTERGAEINSARTLVPPALAIALLSGMVVKADLGTGVVLMAISGAVFFVAGMNRRYFRIAAVFTVIAVSIAIISEPYRLQRVIHWFDPEYKILDRLDPSGTIKNYAQSSKAPPDTRYQAEQATVAFGAGGLSGAGLMQGNQKLGFLPEAHTDFIYAIIGEELGLVGAMAVLSAFVLILLRGFRLYWAALDEFGRYLAVGITVSIVFQALINMSVALDLGPTKGIPLPLVSYGGSSLLSSMMMLGLLLNVSQRAR